MPAALPAEVRRRPCERLERGIVHRNGGKPRSQRLRVAPVRRCRATVEEPRRRQNERARTDGRKPRTTVIGLAEAIDQIDGYGLVRTFQPGGRR